MELDECPICYITVLSEWLLELYVGSHFPTGSSGQSPAVLFGADIARWPAWWFDVMSVIADERAAADAIEMKQ